VISSDSLVFTNPGSGRCPRHVRRALAGLDAPPVLPRTRLVRADFSSEPFRLFFPLAVLAGVLGVALWPLMLSGWMEEYPGVRHARLMIQGLYGGFIFGFLGTSVPRLLETSPLKFAPVAVLAALHLAVIGIYTYGLVPLGDAAFATAVIVWLGLLGWKLIERRDLPPPGFVLMPLAFLSCLAGMALDWYGRTEELPSGAEVLIKLLTYHSFVLLCVLGAGGFLLPRFLGIGVRQKFPSSRTPTREWGRAALVALVAGALILGSCGIEAAGWPAVGAVLRASVVCIYLGLSMPMERLRWSGQGVHWLLVFGLACVPVGIALSGLWPAWRVGLSHLELIGGFGLITFGVATRVVFGHSGNRPQLERFHPGLTVAATLMLLGLVARLSGDLIRDAMIRHYLYAAACWGAGLVIWGICVLPKVLTPDPES
jgi:uncharacterized protein involved in response to NO